MSHGENADAAERSVVVQKEETRRACCSVINDAFPFVFPKVSPLGIVFETLFRDIGF